LAFLHRLKDVQARNKAGHEGLMKSFRPHGWHTVTPRIFTHDVAGLVKFLKTVFNATGESRVGTPAEIRIGDSIVMISDGGGRRETTPAFLYVYVEDADEIYRLAVEAGAESLEKPMDMPYGDRRATVLAVAHPLVSCFKMQLQNCVRNAKLKLPQCQTS
jgi:PhnB protein